MARKATDTVQLKLRFDEKLRRRIEVAAKRNNQSMNAEIIDRLEASFAKADIQEAIEKTAAQMAAAMRNEVFDKPIEAAIAKGAGEDHLTASFQWWILLDWVERHPERPEARRLMERFENWVPGAARTRV